MGGATISGVFRSCHFLGPVLAFWIGSVAALANETWIVDGQGGTGDFVTVQEAVSAAADGDVIVVRAGSHGDVLIDGKSLTLIRQPWSNDPKFFSIEVRNLAASQYFVLRDVRIGSSNLDLERCTIRDCEGPDFLEEVEAFVEVENSANVVLARCHLRGLDSSEFPHADPPPAGAAVRIAGGVVGVYDSIVSGGDGTPAGIPPFGRVPVDSTPGAPGIDVAAGSCFVAGSTVFGGSGGKGYYDGSTCFPSSDGAPALRTAGPCTTMDSGFTAGSPGFDPSPCPQVGVRPPDIDILPGGSVDAVSGDLRELIIGSPAFVDVFEGTDRIPFQFLGTPGESVLLLVSPVPDGRYVRSLTGTRVGAPPWILFPLGVVPSDGKIEFVETAPARLPPGIGGLLLFAQAIVPGPPGRLLLSSPSFVVIVDP